MEVGQSGFMTDLSINNPNDYPDASFKVVKEITELPIVEKPAGLYACILVQNTSVDIVRGLTSLKNFCRKNDLSVKEDLWQINTTNDFVETGASKFGWLEYQIISQKNKETN